MQDRGGGGGGGGWDKIVRNVGINLLFLAGYFILDGGGGGFFGGGGGGGGGKFSTPSPLFYTTHSPDESPFYSSNLKGVHIIKHTVTV